MKKVKKILMVLGVLCIVLAAAVPGYNHFIEKNREEKMEDVLQRFVAVLPATSPSSPALVEEDDMPFLSIDGADICLLLELPSLKLPVGKLWDEETIREYPSVYYGTVGSEDLVIGGSFTEGLFEKASATDIGDKITLTDVYGRAFPYKAEKIIHSQNPEAPDPDLWDLIVLCKKNTKDEYLILYCNSYQ